MHHHQKSQYNCPFSFCSNGLICRHQGSTKSLPSSENAPDYTDHHKLCTILTPQRHNLKGMLLWCSLCEDDETVHRWAGEQPRSHTPWLWCRGSPGPSLEIRGGSDNRLLSVRQSGGGGSGSASTLWSVRLHMAQALCHALSWTPNIISCHVLPWAQPCRLLPALTSPLFLFLFVSLNLLYKRKQEGESRGKFAIFFTYIFYMGCNAFLLHRLKTVFYLSL